MEVIVEKLGLAKVLHFLPGETYQSINLKTMRHPLGVLSEQVGDYVVKVTERAAMRGRRAFRDLHSAYDSLDLMVYPALEKFSHCKSDAESVLSINLSVDKVEGDLITYAKP